MWGSGSGLQEREVALEDMLVVRLEVSRGPAVEEQVAPGVHPHGEDLDDELLPHLG